MWLYEDIIMAMMLWKRIIVKQRTIIALAIYIASYILITTDYYAHCSILFLVMAQSTLQLSTAASV